MGEELNISILGVTKKLQLPVIDTSMDKSLTSSLSSYISESSLSLNATTEANYRLVVSEKSCGLEEMLRSKKVKIAARRSFPANSKAMYVDRLHEQDHANHKRGYSSFSKLDDNFPLGSARHNILALPLNKRRVNNEEILSNEAILENRGSGHRFYADRNDIQNSESPS